MKRIHPIGRARIPLLFVVSLAPAPLLEAQVPSTVPAAQVSDAHLSAVTFRELGPFRGGRVTAVDGVAEQPHTFYFGSTGGGVWKSESGGQAWTNITDGWLDVGSIGAVEVADGNPDILYVGTG
ncbi:MAG: glycosyl hydrolase, partial [Gemmatimonadetes bacterium]|nr:glycosyl hydrolase [Gemmatimonadota bacterium]